MLLLLPLRLLTSVVLMVVRMGSSVSTIRFSNPSIVVKWDTHIARALSDPADMMQKDHKKQLGEISEHLAFDNHSWVWASMVEEIAV